MFKNLKPENLINIEKCNELRFDMDNYINWAPEWPDI